MRWQTARLTVGLVLVVYGLSFGIAGVVTGAGGWKLVYGICMTVTGACVAGNAWTTRRRAKERREPAE